MSLINIFEAFCDKELDRVATEIESEMKAVVAEHYKSGDAERAIHIEKKDMFTRWIGGTDGTGRGVSGTDHLLMLDQGNGGRGSIIKPTRHKYLRLTDGRGNTRAFAKQVHGHDGIHFLEEIASRHR